MVVVVVVVVAGARRAVRRPPKRRVLRLGRVRWVVRGAAVVRWVRRIGMMYDCLETVDRYWLVVVGNGRLVARWAVCSYWL